MSTACPTEATLVITIDLGPMAKLLATAVIEELHLAGSAPPWLDVEAARAEID